MIRPTAIRRTRAAFLLARSVLAPFALGLALIAATGCLGPRIVRDPVYASDTVRVQLRRTLEGGAPVARGYAHPATISDVRFAHVLANLGHEDKQGKRQATIASERVYELAEALNKAAIKATPDDEIAAVVIEESRRLGLFTSRSVTSFRMYFTDTDMVLEFYDVSRVLEAREGRPAQGEDYDIPIGEPTTAAPFRLLTGKGVATAGPRLARIDWRDEYFAKPVSLSVRDGAFKRRTVISEAAPSADTEPARPLDTNPATRDAQIRALDQLDAARRGGLVTEAEFQKRRRLILEGKLKEAGYGESGDGSAP
jgi:hypothetical protein